MSEKSKYVERIDVYSRQGEHLAFLDKIQTSKANSPRCRPCGKNAAVRGFILNATNITTAGRRLKKNAAAQSRPLGQDDVSLDDVDGQKPEIKFSAGRNNLINYI